MSFSTLAGPQAVDVACAGAGNPLGSDAATLIAGARRGERESIGQLLSEHQQYLRLLAQVHLRSRLRPRVSPSDIVQETMLKAHRHFGQFRGQTERELLAWLREILISSLARFVEQHMLAAKRDIRREVSLERIAAAIADSSSRLRPIWQAAGQPPDLRTDPDKASPQPGGDPQPSAECAAHDERAALLQDLLAQLPEHYREVLVLRNIQGLSFEEVATRLSRSSGATRMLWLRAIEKLRAVSRRTERHDP